jgi:hypothetical protein
MGSTDASNLAWQLEHANTPPTGESRKLLENMSALAVELIQTVRLELSGVRNGDGHWDGDRSPICRHHLRDRPTPGALERHRC